METNLVAGRTCGSCTVCCVALTIRDPALQKPQGIACHHLSKGGGCSIYETRPQTCRTFHCGWRHLKWVRETLRPDLSGVLVRLQQSAPDADGASRFGVAFMLLNRDALKAEGLAESVAAAVAADVPVQLNVPGPPGYTSGQARINEILADAVHFKDKAGVLKILRQAWKIGRSGQHRRIVLDVDKAGGDESGGTDEAADT